MSKEMRENDIKQKLQDLKKQLGKKQAFEEAVSSIRSLLRESYRSASPSLRKSFYSVVCRVATILKTRYTAPGFWNAGLGLFQETARMVSEPSERKHLQNCIAQAQEQLIEVRDQSEGLGSSLNLTSRGFLFEGHLTVDPEPPQPEWLVQTNLFWETLSSNFSHAESSRDQMENNDTSEDAANLLQQLVDRIDNVVPMILENHPVAPRAPPASKEAVSKLPVITITEEILAKLGSDAKCSICMENLVVSEQTQELPCEHMFHPRCLKPWLDEHNSCPSCRHELQTDDHAYESWKENEKEAKEEREGAANAVRGGEYMYV